jgi:hypothetical protein
VIFSQWHAALLHIARELSRDGIDRDAINALLERNCVELEIWRVKSLAELRGWLNPDCMSLN